MVLIPTREARALRVLVIGTGSIGRRHIATMQALSPGAQFAFVRDDAREDDYSRSMKATVFGGVQDALVWGPELGIIATPSNRHQESLVPLLEHGVATFVEKPVAVAREHIQELDLLLTGDLPPTQVGCVLRFLPAVKLLKRWIDDGRCGNIVRASFEAGQYLPDWRPMQDYRQSYSADKIKGGGVLFDLVHELDLAVHLFGEMSLIHAATTRCSHLEINCEDAALVMLRSPGGALVSVELDYVSRQAVRRISIVGDQSTVRLDFIARRLEQITAEGVVDACTDGFSLDHAYREELADLINAQKYGSPTHLPLQEGLRATRLAIAASEIAERSDCTRGGS